jgi:hypothetical protein
MAYNKRLMYEAKMTELLKAATPQQLLQLVPEYRPADAGDGNMAFLLIRLLHKELCSRLDELYPAAEPRTDADYIPAEPDSSTAAPGSVWRRFRDSVMIADGTGLVLMPWPVSLIACLLNPGLDAWLRLPRADLDRRFAARGSTLQVQDQHNRELFVPPGLPPSRDSLVCSKGEPLLPVHMLHCSSLVCACDQMGLPYKKVNGMKYASYAAASCVPS